MTLKALIERLEAAEGPEFTCASCRQLADCQSAFGAPGEVGLGCADWEPSAAALRAREARYVNPDGEEAVKRIEELEKAVEELQRTMTHED